MMAMKVGSSLKGLLGLNQAPYSEAQERLDLAALQEAHARLSSRLADESLSRSELIDLADGLEPLAQKLRRVLNANKARGGQTRATRLMDDALRALCDCLYCVQPFRPYIWPAALRAKLHRALHSLAYALVAARWAQVS